MPAYFGTHLNEGQLGLASDRDWTLSSASLPSYSFAAFLRNAQGALTLERIDQLWLCPGDGDGLLEPLERLGGFSLLST